MAWPPPVLAINRTDATPQQTTHAADHNAHALAINDVVTALGPGPGGGEGSVTAKFGVVDQAILNERLPNWIGGVNHVTNGAGFGVAAGTAAVSTDVNGDFLINFPGGLFSSRPFVVCASTKSTPNVLITTWGEAASGFWGHAVYSNSDVAAPVGSNVFGVNWIAIGPK